MIAEDNRVAVHFSARGTHTGQWLHFAPTGIPIEYTVEKPQWNPAGI